jgi:hypothetical protein
MLIFVQNQRTITSYEPVRDATSFHPIFRRLSPSCVDCFRDDKAGKFKIDLTNLSEAERRRLVVQKRGQAHGTMPYRLILTGDLQNLQLEFIASRNESVRRTFAINLEDEQLTQREMGSFVVSSPLPRPGGGSPTLSPPPEPASDGADPEQSQYKELSAVQRGKLPVARQQKRRSNFRFSEGESSKRMKYTR